MRRDWSSNPEPCPLLNAKAAGSQPETRVGEESETTFRLKTDGRELSQPSIADPVRRRPRKYAVQVLRSSPRESTTRLQQSPHSTRSLFFSPMLDRVLRKSGRRSAHATTIAPRCNGLSPTANSKRHAGAARPGAFRECRAAAMSRSG